jgi:hypothetical protein
MHTYLAKSINPPTRIAVAPHRSPKHAYYTASTKRHRRHQTRHDSTKTPAPQRKKRNKSNTRCLQRLLAIIQLATPSHPPPNTYIKNRNNTATHCNNRSKKNKSRVRELHTITQATTPTPTVTHIVTNPKTRPKKVQNTLTKTPHEILAAT